MSRWFFTADSKQILKQQTKTVNLNAEIKMFRNQYGSRNAEDQHATMKNEFLLHEARFNSRVNVITFHQDDVDVSRFCIVNSSTRSESNEDRMIATTSEASSESKIQERDCLRETVKRNARFIWH